MKINFLGTGAGLPSKYRNTQSIVLNFMDELKECWMIDCGEATQHKIMKNNIKPRKINKIFISHFHGDHILGLMGFLSSRNFLLSEEETPLTIYGPTGIKEYVELNLSFLKVKLSYDIQYIEYNANNIIFENDKVEVKVFQLNHTIDSYGFEIKFKNKKGSLKAEKLKEIGIMPGPFYKEIKNNEYFTYNNKKYFSKDFLEKEKKGKVLTIISDTIYFDELLDKLTDTDILITECTYLKEEDYELAKKHKHLNIIDINNFYNYKKFDKMYLTHISSRYDKKELIDIEKNIKLKFENLELVNDLDEYEITI